MPHLAMSPHPSNKIATWWKQQTASPSA